MRCSAVSLSEELLQMYFHPFCLDYTIMQCVLEFQSCLSTTVATKNIIPEKQNFLSIPFSVSPLCLHISLVSGDISSHVDVVLQSWLLLYFDLVFLGLVYLLSTLNY